jgi:transposase-like protein
VIAASAEALTVPSNANRPTRAVIERLIRESAGNMTHLAARLGCTRQTCYTWVYQLGLQDVVGMRLADEEQAGDGEAKAGAEKRRAVTVKLCESVWKRLKIRAIEDDTTMGAIVEEAARRYLERGL